MQSFVENQNRDQDESDQIDPPEMGGESRKKKPRLPNRKKRIQVLEEDQVQMDPPNEGGKSKKKKKKVDIEENNNSDIQMNDVDIELKLNMIELEQGGLLHDVGELFE